MLWFCKFKDSVSLLVDSASKETAIAIATENAEEAPLVAIQLPDGVFRAEVFDGDAGDTVTVDVDPGTLFVLGEFEDAEVGGHAPRSGVCTSTADDADGNAIRCALSLGHDGDHENQELVWS